MGMLAIQQLRYWWLFGMLIALSLQLLTDYEVQIMFTITKTAEEDMFASRELLKEAAFCLDQQGSSGRWIQDWEYAAAAQYETFPNPVIVSSQLDWQKKRERYAQQRFGPTEDAPYRWATSWRWKDDTECNNQLITLDNLCQTTARLNATRIHVVGDSMSNQFASSLLSLVGHAHETANDYWNRPLNISCPESSNIEFLYQRWDFFKSLNGTDLAQQRTFSGDNPHRTVLVVNIGAHIKSEADFKSNFTALTEWIDSRNRPNDIVFYRDANPGHFKCSQKGHPRGWKPTDRPIKVVPYENYTQWADSGSRTVHNWGLIEYFNEYARAQIGQRRERSKSAGSVDEKQTPMYYVNIFNSTVLRRDGHIWKNDCLHYFIPGPTDWWVHMWYTALSNVATLESFETQK